MNDYEFRPLYITNIDLKSSGSCRSPTSPNVSGQICLKQIHSFIYFLKQLCSERLQVIWCIKSMIQTQNCEANVLQAQC